MAMIRKINDPICIIASESSPNDSVVVVVDETINGHQVIAPVRVSVDRLDGGVMVSINQLSTAFGKNGFREMLSRAIQAEIASGSIGIYYWNNEKAKALSSHRLQLPKFSQHNGVIHTVQQNPSFVNQKNANTDYTTNGTKTGNTNSQSEDVQQFSISNADASYMAAEESRQNYYNLMEERQNVKAELDKARKDLKALQNSQEYKDIMNMIGKGSNVSMDEVVSRLAEFEKTSGMSEKSAMVK